MREGLDKLWFDTLLDIARNRDSVKESFLKAFIADHSPPENIHKLSMRDLKLVERITANGTEYTVAVRDELDDATCAKAFDSDQPRPHLSDATEFRFDDDHDIKLSYGKWVIKNLNFDTFYRNVDNWTNHREHAFEFSTPQQAWAAAEQMTKDKK